MLKTATIEYRDGDIILEAYYAWKEGKNKLPAILIAHDWTGRNQLACDKANKLAEEGYLGFALDMFGKGKLGKTKEEKSAMIQPFMEDRLKLQKRVLAAFETVTKLEQVDTAKIGAIGFCFGGLVALDLARSGADIKGVVSFHGLLNAPNIAKQAIKAKILALHGFDDPMVTPDQVMAFGNEMTHAKANWELDIYGNTMHAFTNPEANDAAFGTVYNKQADARSWVSMQNFFKEVL